MSIKKIKKLALLIQFNEINNTLRTINKKMKKILLIIFVVLSININAQRDSSLCNKIERIVDDMTGKITIGSPSEEAVPSLKLVKVILAKDTLYLFRLRTYGITLNISETGVIILFTDGTKMIKETKIAVDIGDETNSWLYKANITASSEDLKILATKTIKKFRLFIYDKDINEKEGNDFREYVNCILKAN